jgi:hypothetical protein
MRAERPLRQGVDQGPLLLGDLELLYEAVERLLRAERSTRQGVDRGFLYCAPVAAR